MCWNDWALVLWCEWFVAIDVIDEVVEGDVRAYERVRWLWEEGCIGWIVCESGWPMCDGCDSLCDSGVRDGLG